LVDTKFRNQASHSTLKKVTKAICIVRYITVWGQTDHLHTHMNIVLFA